MPRVYLGLGSNIERERNIRSGVAALRERFGALTVSPVYETEPVGFEGPPFYNLVVGLDTELPAAALVAELHAIEAEHGRAAGGPRFVSRQLDIDLLTYGDAVIEEGRLRVPRPEITRYAFVLRPLADIAGDERHPVDGRTYAELWAAHPGGEGEMQPTDLRP